MRLPPDLIIGPDKLRHYLLIQRPTDDKSRYLASAGFNRLNPEQLGAAIRELALTSESHEDGRDAYGIFWWHAPVNMLETGVSRFQRVALTRDVPEHRLQAGDIASVVDFVPHPDGGETGCVIEVFNAVGESIAVVAVPLSAIEPLAADEVLAIRRLATPRESA